MFELDTLAKKIGFGYLLVGLMLIVAAVTTVWQVQKSTQLSDTLREQRVPTLEAGLIMLNGMNQSLAALRGWITLGEEQFIDERERAWELSIHSGLRSLEVLESSSESQANRARLVLIKTKLRELERYQLEIEAIAKTDANNPALILMTQKIKPLMHRLTQRLETIAGLEGHHLSGISSNARSERVEVFETIMSLLSIYRSLIFLAEEYLLMGKDDGLDKFKSALNQSQLVLNQLGDIKDYLVVEGLGDFREVILLNEQLIPILNKMVELRRSDRWNVANFWLKTRAIPVATEIINTLEAIIVNAKNGINSDLIKSKTLSDFTNLVEWLLLIIGLITCLVMGVVVSRSVSQPFQKTLDVAAAVAAGDFDVDTNFDGSKEMVLLSMALSDMTASLRNTAQTAEAIAAGRLDVEVDVKGSNDKLAHAVSSMLKAARELNKETEWQVAALVDSESRSNGIINSMVDGLVNIDCNGIISLFNPAAEAIFQYKTDEVIGRNIKTLIPSSHSAKHDSYLSAYLRTNDHSFIGMPREVEARRKDGETFPASIVVTEITAGGEKNFIATIRDVTKQKKIEQKEVEAREELENEKEKLLEQDWIKSNYASVIEKIQGACSIEEMCSEFLNAMTPLINGEVAIFFIREGVDQSVSGKRDRNGVLSLMSSYAYKKRNSTRNQYALGEGIVGQAAIERKQIVLTDVPEGYLEIDTGIGVHTPKVVVVTPVLFEGDLLGVLEVGALTEFTRQQQELMDQLVGNLGVFISTIIGRSHAEYLLARTREQTNALRQRENQLREANEEMVRKTKVAEQANRAKSEFLANMSHELRTPLNSLLILAESLSGNKEGNLTEQQLEATKIIHQSGSDLLILINDILDLAKVEAGKMGLNIERFHINSIAEAMHNQFDHIAEEKGLVFNVKMAPDLPDTMVSDRHRIEQIIKNFLSNAFKFTHEGEVNLSILNTDGEDTQRQGLNKESAIQVKVKDSGIGIAKEKLRKIFDAFEQGDGSTSREYGGTGLGLRICEELCELLGGEIGASSDLGAGSEFTLTLPLVYAIKDDDDQECADKLDRQAGEVSPELRCIAVSNDGEDNGLEIKTPEFEWNGDRGEVKPGDEYILIVEDDIHFANVIAASIKKAGVKCLISVTGKEAIRLVTEFPPVALVLDIGLPDISGLEVLDELKSHKSTSSIPVYFISIYENDALETDAVGYLTKPVSQSQLDVAISTLLSAAHIGGTRFLIIVDDPATKNHLGSLLESKNFGVTYVASAEEAIYCIKDKEYNGIFLDLLLPGMSGLKLLDMIDSDVSLSLPPVIAYSSKEISEDERSALEKYTKTFIDKNSINSEKVLEDVLSGFNQFSYLVPQVKIVEVPDECSLVKKTSSGVEIDDSLNGTKVLLVDDDTRNIFALSLLLKQAGMIVQIANNGAMALELLTSDGGQFDIVLMDIMMPVMDGYEAIRRIREQEQFENLPVIAVSAKALADDIDRCFDVGATDYLSKPIEAAMLLNKISCMLTNRQAASKRLSSEVV